MFSGSGDFILLFHGDVNLGSFPRHQTGDDDNDDTNDDASENERIGSL